MSDRIGLIPMRHGRSRADDENVHEGRYDAPLTDAGRAQLCRRGEQLRAAGYRPDAIVASTLQRASESASLLGAMLGARVDLDAGWMEFDNGPLAGLSFAEADRRFPRPAFRTPFSAWHGSGESEVEFHARIALALQRVLRRGPGSFLVLTHGGALNAAVRIALGMPLPVHEMGQWFAFGDAGYCRLD